MYIICPEKLRGLGEAGSGRHEKIYWVIRRVRFAYLCDHWGSRIQRVDIKKLGVA